MSLNNNINMNFDLLKEKKSIYKKHENNRYNMNFFPFLEISINFYFNILSTNNNKACDKIDIKLEDKNSNFNINLDIRFFLDKLYNDNSILVINKYNIDNIFDLFKKIILSKANEYFTSLFININNFEIREEKINDDKIFNQNNKNELIKSEKIEMKKCKTEIIKDNNNSKLHNNTKFNKKLIKFYTFNKKTNNLSLEKAIINKKYHSYDFKNKNNKSYFKKYIANDLQKKENSEIINNIKKNLIFEKTKLFPKQKDNNTNELIKSEREYSNLKKSDESQKLNPYLKEIKVNKLNAYNNGISSTYKEKEKEKDKLIKQKIKELEIETLKFKEEKNRIIDLKNEYQKLQKQLIEDIEQFELKKDKFEKYKQNEMDKIKRKKIFNANNNINNKILLNSKNDKDIIKLLKGQIKDLENVIKLKDDEIKMYTKNKNIKTILKYSNDTNRKIYNNSASKKCFSIVNKKNGYDQAFSEKNIKNKQHLNAKPQTKENKKIINNDLYNNIINSISNNNNYTINANSSKNYFKNINKNLSKLKINNFLNISYTNNNQLSKNISKKEYNNSNNNNKYMNNKSKINASYHKNYKNSELKSRKNLYSTETKEYAQKLFLQNESKRKREMPKVKLDFKPKDKIIEMTDDIFDKMNYYIEEDKELNLSNNLFNKEENKKISSKEKAKPIKSLNKKFYSNINSKNKYNATNSKNRINIIKMMKNSFNRNNKLKNNINSIKNKNKIKIINKYKSNSATKNENRIKKKIDNLKEENIKNDNNILDIINSNNDKNKEIDKNNNKIKENEYEFIIPEKYKNKENYKLIKKIESEGKTIYIYSHNKKEIVFKSGVRKEIFNDGYQLVHFPNGDIKQNYEGGKVIYFFNDSKAVQTSYKDGLNVFKFNNNQIEKHYPDGSKFIIFPNGTKRRVSKNGNEETIYPDGKIQKSYNINENKNNEEELSMDSIEGIDDNKEHKNVFMSYLDIEQNEIDDE